MAKKKPQLGNLMDAMAMKPIAKPMPKAAAKPTAKKKTSKKPTTKCKSGKC